MFPTKPDSLISSGLSKPGHCLVTGQWRRKRNKQTKIEIYSGWIWLLYVLFPPIFAVPPQEPWVFEMTSLNGYWCLPIWPDWLANEHQEPSGLRLLWDGTAGVHHHMGLLMQRLRLKQRQVLSWLSHLPHAGLVCHHLKPSNSTQLGSSFCCANEVYLKIILPTSLFPSLKARTRSWLPRMYFCPNSNCWMIRCKLWFWLGRRGCIFWRRCSPAFRDIQTLVRGHRKIRLGTLETPPPGRKLEDEKDLNDIFLILQMGPLVPINSSLASLLGLGGPTRASWNWNMPLIRTGRTHPLQQGEKPGRSAYRATPVREKSHSKHRDKNRSPFGSAWSRTSRVMLSMDKQKLPLWSLTWPGHPGDEIFRLTWNSWSSHRDFLCLKHTLKEVLPPTPN